MQAYKVTAARPTTSMTRCAAAKAPARRPAVVSRSSSAEARPATSPAGLASGAAALGLVLGIMISPAPAFADGDAPVPATTEEVIAAPADAADAAITSAADADATPAVAEVAEAPALADEAPAVTDEAPPTAEEALAPAAADEGAVGAGDGEGDAAPIIAADELAAAAPAAAEILNEKEEFIQEQRAEVEYKLEQGEIARRAEILGKKQAVERELEEVEDVIQRKLIEEDAALVEAEKKGDEKAIEFIEDQKEKIKDQEAAIRNAASQLKARLDKIDIVEKAREIGLKQQLDKATASVKKLLGLE
ncbi:hypothetical protein MNEG_4659 [Monoraphidium neglectum]|uniref:Uncharacterized protein n=1 Tax=Monoraphidium neglectum TaxID=145388 RepID=A0A0D2MSB4_9CHLO|nr:hypothetical protein MNEG_4659 [Monoraphidium neglectum]KIZ03297.1 hypothetical protein MNEG_4659 [Monoraphidium neglectum]|eukprot:XP_013902316.1 hypothetical protein MNEG_4659 [Monoraphidium neglectum]